MKMLPKLKNKSKEIRKLLMKQLGASSDENLSYLLGNYDERKLICSKENVLESNKCNLNGSDKINGDYMSNLMDIGVDRYHLNKRKLIRINNELSEKLDENSVFTYPGSSTFLKGTNNSNPHNDYCQHFVDTGQRPQNFIRDVGLEDRFEEYPKLKELIKLKNEVITKTATTPMYLKTDLHTFDFKELKSKFDVILIEPPLEVYQRTHGVTNMDLWSWEQVKNLPIEEISDRRGFVFLWCGSSDGLDLGRECLRKWGFRRCEDICWIKTNIKNPGHSKNLEPKGIFQRTKEHCLMGIKGTVKRSTDGDFIHANIDIDLIISEEPDYGSIEKPEEIIHIIEHFCLGRRRLHIFGRDSTIRPGWLTIGPDLMHTNFKADTYLSFFDSKNGNLTGCTDRIESLRPKTPPPKAKNRQHTSRTTPTIRPQFGGR